MRQALLIVFMVCIAGVCALPVSAHPHIYAKYEVAVAPHDADTNTLHFVFKIHNVVVQHPLFHDPQLLEGDLLAAIIQHPFVLLVDLDGHSLEPQNVGLARIGGADNEPLYSFDMEVPTAVKNFGFLIYDPSYYDAVTLDGADALKISVPKLNCMVTRRNMGQTMWGDNMASYISCGDGQHNTLPRKLNKFPDENLGVSNKPSLLDDKQVLP